MNRPFMVPTYYQSVADSLPGMSARAPVAYAGGQHENVVGPWQAQAQDIHEVHRTTEGGGSWGGYRVPSSDSPVHDLVGVYGQGVRQLPDEMTRSHVLSLGGLGRTSGSVMRELREKLPRYRNGGATLSGLSGLSAINPAAFGSSSGFLQGGHGTGATVYANVRDLRGIHRGFRGLGATDAWYENPWYLGAGAALIVGGVWFMTRKKR